MPVRATSRSYRANQSDYERLHLAEAIGYLRNAPVRDDDAGLTHVELNTVIARLELRKRMLGGFVSQRQAALVGEDDGFEHERIRSRNWELLRQCAERTGLIFEPIDLSSRPGQYAILWFPLGESSPNPGFPLEPIWKLLNIRDPWSDSRLKQWSGVTYQRSLDESGSFVPVRADAPRQVSLVPLAVYSLSYRKAPLLLLDFRDRLHVRRHEMTQRTINEVTAGVIGISHFTNWYYYVAADLYNFVTARHGAAVDQSARLDCYSAFRAELRLDNQLDPVLRAEMERRVQSLDVNPLESSPERDLQVAQARYDLLQSEARTNGSLLVHLEKDRRSELAAFGETPRQKLAYSLLHLGSFGLYTHRLKEDPSNLALLDRDRRIEYELGFLDSLVAAGTQPQVAYDTLRIQGAVVDLSGMMSRVDSPELRAHVEVTLERLRGLSSDGDLRASCSEALLSLNHGKDAAAASSAQAGVNATNALALVHAVAEPPR